MLQPHICDCQTHKLQQTVVGGGGNGHATALQQSSRYYADNNVQPPRNQLQQQYGGGGGTGGRRHVPTADYNNENGNYWRYGDDGAAAAVATLMTDKTAVASTDSTAGSPVVVHGGSVQVVSPSLLSSPHVVRNVYENDDAAAAAVAFASPFSGDAPGPVALLRLLFGPELLHAINPLHDGGHKVQLSFCNRLAVVGRFLGRLLEPLFTTGFYMAASYFFRTTILPRIAQFLHVYTMSTMKDHNDGGDDDDHHHHPHHDVVVGRSKSDDGPDSDPPCFRKLACEAGRRLVMQAVNDPIARSIRRYTSIYLRIKYNYYMGAASVYGATRPPPPS